MNNWRSQGRSKNSLSSIIVFSSFLAIVLSIIWPRYGFFNIGPARITPYTLFALAFWVLFPFLVAFRSDVQKSILNVVSSRPIFFAFLGAWVCWRVLASVTGSDPAASITYLARELIYLLPALAFAVIVAHVHRGRFLALSAVIISTVMVSAFALLEMYSGQSVVRALGAEFSGDAQLLANISETNRRGGVSEARIQSTFYHPIVFAQYLSWAAPFLLFGAMARSTLLVRIAAGICLALLPFLIFATNARSGLIAIAASLATYVAIAIVRRVGLFSLQSAATAFLAMALILGALSTGHGTLSGQVQGRNAVEAASTQSRAVMFERGLSEISASPLVGFGDGQSPKYAGLRGRNGILTIDSAFLSSLIDSGWMGLFLNLSVWGLALASAVKAALHTRATGFDAAVAASLVGAMSVFAVLSIMDNLSLIYISIGLTSTALLRERYRLPVASAASSRSAAGRRTFSSS